MTSKVVDLLVFLYGKIQVPSGVMDPVGGLQHLLGPSTFQLSATPLPYTVPVGHWLGIVYAELGSKGGNEGRDSMLVVSGVGIATDQGDMGPYPIPVMLHPLTVLALDIINNETWQQNMTGIAEGILIKSDIKDPKLAGKVLLEAGWPTYR